MSNPRIPRPFFCGNWKLWGTVSESVALATGVRDAVAGVTAADVAVGPGFVALATVADKLKGGNVGVASQDGYWEVKGAFTGEVAMAQIADAGARYAIVGHSERRQYFGETDETVARKAKAALANGLVPIICIGETLSERDAGQALAVVARQLDGSTKGLSDDELLEIRHRLRASLGHRHRPRRDPGTSTRGPRIDTRSARQAPGSTRATDSDSLRRQREAG